MEVGLEFLANNGAGLFSQVLYNVPLLSRALANPNLSIIVAPSDAALQRLTTKTGKSLAELQRDAYGIDIFANHLSVTSTKKEWPMFTAINKQNYGSTEQDILALDVKATTMINRVVIIVIDRLILHGEQLAKASMAARIPGNLAPLQNNAMLMVLIQTGQLKGKDLISLCVSHPEVNQLCDAKIDFNLLLKRDFNAIAPAGVKPRDYYVELSQGYFAWSNIQAQATILGLGLVSPVSQFVQVACGRTFTAYLNYAGEVYISGSLPLTKPGVARMTSDVPEEKNFGPVPVKVDGLPKITNIRSGRDFIVMQDKSGSLWLYGYCDQFTWIRKRFTHELNLAAGQGNKNNFIRAAVIDNLRSVPVTLTPLKLDMTTKDSVVNFAANRKKNELVIVVDALHTDLQPGANYTRRYEIQRVLANSELIITTKDERLEEQLLNSIYDGPGNVRYAEGILKKQVMFENHAINLFEYGDVVDMLKYIYPPEPQLKFIDIVFTGFNDNLFALSEDNRLFELARVVTAEGDRMQFVLRARDIVAIDGHDGFRTFAVLTSTPKISLVE